MKLTKSYPVHQLKADPEGKGIVEAIVSVFGNVDLVGDRVVKGAFAKSIAGWKSKNTNGRFLPFTDGHDWTREGRIGKVLDMAETDEGLLVKAQLFMQQESAREVFMQIKEGVLGEFSFAYDVVRERQAEDGANDLLELELLDASTALHGANSETHLVGVKAVDTSSWDGNQAMGACETASDYRSICAGERSEGEPDQRQHWALPHHYLGKGPNADGVRNALSRLPQTQGLTNRDGAQSHLDAHMAQINPEKAEPTVTLDSYRVTGVKVGRSISAKNETKLRAARDALDEVLASLGDEAPSAASANGDGKTDEPVRANVDDHPVLARLRKALDPQ